MPQIPANALPFRMNFLIEDMVYWWDHATPNDFGMLAVAIVVAAWFVTKYYLD